MTVSSARSVIGRFNRLKALVVGDVMLDHYVWGSVSRISPEAPVPVVAVQRESEMPGGAGNVAINMAALGAEVSLAALIGDDAAGDRLLDRFKTLPIRTDAVIRTKDRPTILKSRVIAHQQQVVRVDYETQSQIPSAITQQLWTRLESQLARTDVVVISDYAKGVVTSGLLGRLIPLVRRRGIPVTVDPKRENFRYYRRVSCITPNVKEALEGAQLHSADTNNGLESIGDILLRKLQAEAVLITRGEHGMSLFERNKPAFHIPARAQEVFDVTGAGDTVISALSLALAAGASLRTAAELANHAAGIVVGKLGTATATSDELMKAIRSHEQ
ncbi:MAG TPA: D-glycero-beta-D-manno-heptose-7-phosphate kinase [Elusimicrobiota bacterium]|nr:D-glycero-beta-D-manno-heptose-7-phosphate kinase [Elusimicrobiota bacterium]